MKEKKFLLVNKGFLTLTKYTVLSFPQSKKTKKRRKSIMAYVINDSCISCGTCEGNCPVGAISQGDSQYTIDADTCISCGTCAGNCPVGAISEE